MNPLDPNFWSQLQQSWNSDFIPNFMIGLRIFLIALGLILLTVIVILVLRVIRSAKSEGGNTDKSKEDKTK